MIRTDEIRAEIATATAAREWTLVTVAALALRCTAEGHSLPVLVAETRDRIRDHVRTHARHVGNRDMGFLLGYAESALSHVMAGRRYGCAAHATYLESHLEGRD